MSKKESSIPSIPSSEVLKSKLKEMGEKDSINKEIESSTIPSIGVVGCGGCGTNIIKALKLDKQYKDFIKEYIVDTSLSNVKGLEPHVEMEIIKTDDKAIGSGRIRKTNVKEIQQNISKLKCITDNKDITIVIHSASGGSGSVIGPLVTKQLAINKKAFIVILVIDSVCKVSTNNTINTINSYKQMCEDENIYVPSFVISNVAGKQIVDESIIYFLNNFVGAMLLNEIEDTDLLNKLNFLRPNVINEDNVGFYEINMFNTIKDLEEVNENIHGLYFLNTKGDITGIDIPNSYIVYTGKYPMVSDDSILAFAIGMELKKDTIEYLQSKLEHYHSMSISNGSSTTKIGSNKNIGSSDKSGLIL